MHFTTPDFSLYAAPIVNFGGKVCTRVERIIALKTLISLTDNSRLLRSFIRSTIPLYGVVITDLLLVPKVGRSFVWYTLRTLWSLRYRIQKMPPNSLITLQRSSMLYAFWTNAAPISLASAAVVYKTHRPPLTGQPIWIEVSVSSSEPIISFLYTSLRLRHEVALKQRTSQL